MESNPKLKLKHTRQSEAVKELLFIANGVPYPSKPVTSRLGGSSVGVKEVSELLKIFVH